MYDHVIISGRPRPISEAEVDALEAALGTRFPQGYRAFVTRFGAGVLGDTYLTLSPETPAQDLDDDEAEAGCDIRVYLPAQILDEKTGQSDWRDRIREYWFWDAGAGTLTREKALECIILGDTTVGDEIVFHPSEPDRLYILPRDEEMIYAVEGGLPAAIEWLFGSGVLHAAFSARCFKAA